MNHQLKDILHIMISKEMGMDIKTLKEMWKGYYNPCFHLFGSDENGNFVCQWELKKDTWELIGSSYCRWMCLPIDRCLWFWVDMYIYITRTYDWYDKNKCSDEFKMWLLEKTNDCLLKYNELRRSENPLLPTSSTNINPKK